MIIQIALGILLGYLFIVFGLPLLVMIVLYIYESYKEKFYFIIAFIGYLLCLALILGNVQNIFLWLYIIGFTIFGFLKFYNSLSSSEIDKPDNIEVKELKKIKTLYYCEDCNEDIDQERWWVRIFFFILMIPLTIVSLIYLLASKPYQCPKCKSRTSLWRTMNGQKEKVKANSKWSFVVISIVTLVFAYSLVSINLIIQTIEEQTVASQEIPAQESISHSNKIDFEEIEKNGAIEKAKDLIKTVNENSPFKISDELQIIKGEFRDNTIVYTFEVLDSPEDYDFDLARNDFVESTIQEGDNPEFIENRLKFKWIFVDSNNQYLADFNYPASQNEVDAANEAEENNSKILELVDKLIEAKESTIETYFTAMNAGDYAIGFNTMSEAKKASSTSFEEWAEAFFPVYDINIKALLEDSSPEELVYKVDFYNAEGTYEWLMHVIQEQGKWKTSKVIGD